MIIVFYESRAVPARILTFLMRKVVGDDDDDKAGSERDYFVPQGRHSEEKEYHHPDSEQA
mgnify:CR=1 FL=1